MTGPVLIAGCGDLGTGLGERLASDGAAVLGLRRNPEGLPGGIEPVAADLRSAETLAGALDPLPAPDTVVIAVTADERDAEAYRATYLRGTVNLQRCLAEQGASPRRTVFVSSTAVYGQRDGSWVDEDSPTNPRSGTGTVIRETEQRVLAGPGRGVVVRFGGIYGPGRTRLLDRVRAGEASYPEIPQYTNRIHRDDCVGVLHHLLGLSQPEEVYAAVDHDPADRGTVLRWLAERLDAPSPRRTRGTGRRGRNKRVANGRLVGSGYEFRYPTFREGYQSLIGATS